MPWGSMLRLPGSGFGDWDSGAWLFLTTIMRYDYCTNARLLPQYYWNFPIENNYTVLLTIFFYAW